MKVLIACEFSGVVRNAFLKRGHDAWSCDWGVTWEEPKDRHIKGDVEPLLKQRWDLVIAHPPCTYLCNSGRCHLQIKNGRNKVREQKMIAACQFFLECLEANSDRICVENPIMMRECVYLIGEDYTQLIQPWMFGHEEQKATCLWLKGLPELVPTKIVDKRKQVLHYLSPGPQRKFFRSITYQGIADAMAEQWG